jgi:hypothetical protein
MWAGILTTDSLGETDMPLKAAHIATPFPESTVSSEKSESPFDSIALFCGICLLAFLVAVVTGVQGVWI